MPAPTEAELLARLNAAGLAAPGPATIAELLPRLAALDEMCALVRTPALPPAAEPAFILPAPRA